MLRYFLIFDQICIFWYQLEPKNLELKTGKISPKNENFENLAQNFRFFRSTFFNRKVKKNLPY